MNKLFISSALFLTAYTAAATAAPMGRAPAYAGAISAHNIATIQHSIFNMANDGFDTIGLHVGAPEPRAITATSDAPNAPAQAPRTTADSTKLYGHMPMYGTMSMYGEYGDDGIIFAPGRSGGDIAAPTLHTWATAAYFTDDEKFDHLRSVHTKTTAAMAGIGTARARLGAGFATFGGYAGYAGGTQRNSQIDLTQNSGFVGGYASYHIGRFITSGTMTLGKMYSDLDKKFGDTDFDNLWLGLGVGAAYDILLDPTFTLQPGLTLGYTWVNADDYKIGDHRITNENLSVYEIAPALRAIKHISNGWFASLGAKYVIRFSDGGDVKTDHHSISELDPDNYAEYGVSLEKSIGAFTGTASIGRRDGGRSGWNGSINLKYIF